MMDSIDDRVEVLFNLEVSGFSTICNVSKSTSFSLNNFLVYSTQDLSNTSCAYIMRFSGDKVNPTLKSGSNLSLV